MPQARESRVSPRQLVALVCAAQVLVQFGAFFWPALLPGLLARWELTYGEAGWITAAFYGAYILAVPVLVTLTDRIDAKLVYLIGVAMTVAGHLLFGLLADGFWSAMTARALTGAGSPHEGDDRSPAVRDAPRMPLFRSLAGLLEMLVRSGLADTVGRAHLYRSFEDAAGDDSA